MNSPKEIADGMLAIFNAKKESGVEVFMVSALSGIVKIPGDLYALTKDFLDSDHRWDNETDRIRLITMLKKGATSDDLKRLLEIVIKKYVQNLNEEKCQRLLTKLGGSTAGSMMFKAIFINQIVTLFVSRVIPKFLFSAGMTGIITIGASVSRSIYSSRDLSKKNFEVYSLLRASGDLDLLYFVLEDYIDPYLEAISLENVNSPLAENVFEFFLEGMQHV